MRSFEDFIPLYKVNLPSPPDVMPQLEKVLYSGQISEGEQVESFEKEFRRHFALPPGRAFSSATAALHTALILAGVKPGSEVISTPITVEPTNMAILHSGARVVFADVDPDNGNLLPESIEEKIGPKTRAIMVVHYSGIPVSLRRLNEIARKYRLPVIEDAAHALGARYGGKYIGASGNYTIFSFQAIKHLTTIDGGFLVLRDEEEDERARRIRWFGIDRRKERTGQRISEPGYKYNMNDVSASLGRIQLRFIDSILERHRENGRFFDRNLQGIDGLTPCRWDKEAEPSYWIYPVRVSRRDDFLRAMNSRGIGAGIGSIRNDLHPVFGNLRQELKNAVEFDATLAHLPCGWWVKEPQRVRILEAIKKGW